MDEGVPAEAQDDAIADLEARANLWLRKGDGARLVETAAELLARRPEEPRSWWYAALGELLQDREDAGVERLRRALALDPQHRDSLLALARTLKFRRKGKQEAESLVRRVLERDPEDADAWTELGEILHLQEDERGAAACAKRALAIAPDDADALHLLANIAPDDTPAKARDALALYEKALAADPQDASVHHNLAITALRAGDVDRAEEAVRRALDLRPTRRDYRRTLFQVMRRRSIVYRILRWPGDAAWKAVGWLSALPMWAWIALAVVGIYGRALVLFLAVAILWGLFVWPILKVYEATILSDLRAGMREIGARRGGWLGFHGWPRAVRLGVFAVLAAGFWYGTWLLLRSKTGLGIVVVIVIVGIAFVFVAGLVVWILEARAKRRHRRRLRELQAIG
jgi:tetratricopeptide (TPR) repeat protein